MSAAPSTRCLSKARSKAACTWAWARRLWRSRRSARGSTSGRRCWSTSRRRFSICPRSRRSSSRRSIRKALTAPKKRDRVLCCRCRRRSAPPCTTHSAFGSMRSRSHRRRWSRPCAGKRRASRRGTDRNVSRRSPIRRPSRWSRPRKMLRLPRFNYLRPTTAGEAARMAADLGPRAMFVAGGTDLFPKLKRRQFEVDSVIGLGFLPRGIRNGSDECVIDAGVTLAHASHDPHLIARFAGYAEAAGLVSSPPLRNAGTIGGNLCVDTRCNYYDMTYEWRKAAGFCLKKDGDICLVAPSSPRCWAVSSSDTAPMAMALEGVVTLVGVDGEREVPVASLYRDDGIEYMAKQPSEVVTALRLKGSPNTRSAYVKLRRRGSIDFPIAGAAVALQLDGEVVSDCRIVLSAVASYPLEATAAEVFLKGKRLEADGVREAVELGAQPAKPLRKRDLRHLLRKRMVRVVVEQALARATTNGGASVVKLSGR